MPGGKGPHIRTQKRQGFIDLSVETTAHMPTMYKARQNVVCLEQDGQSKNTLHSRPPTAETMHSNCCSARRTVRTRVFFAFGVTFASVRARARCALTPACAVAHVLWFRAHLLLRVRRIRAQELDPRLAGLRVRRDERPSPRGNEAPVRDASLLAPPTPSCLKTTPGHCPRCDHRWPTPRGQCAHAHFTRRNRGPRHTEVQSRFRRS